MTPYLERDGVTIYNGDARAVLAELPADSVHCCVTSPPYWGLRDYGTAKWEGGDLECDHAAAIYRAAADAVGTRGDANKIEQQIAGKLGLWKSCPSCGAAREDLQIGIEPTPAEYVHTLVGVFREVGRVLREDGTLWLNLGDSYNAYNGGAGPSSNLSKGAQTTERPHLETGYGLRDKSLKPKDLVGIPWLVAFALREDGWYLRQDIIWSKPNPMPESVTDRCTKAHEYIFLLSRGRKYHYDQSAILEACAYADEAKYDNGQNGHGGGESHAGQGSSTRKFRVNGGASFGKQNHSTDGTGAQSRQYDRPAYENRNRRSVWTVTTKPFKGAHFAVFPPELIEPCILAGCPEGGTVLDPFFGSGTTGAVAQQNLRNCIGIDLNPDYCKLAAKRFRQRRLLTSNHST